MTRLDPARRALVDSLLRDAWPSIEDYLSSKLPTQEVEDVGQAVILAFVERFGPGIEAPRAYLWQIARNSVARHWERHMARRGFAFDSERHSIHDIGPTLSSIVGRRHRVQQALQELPLDVVTALELRFVVGLSIDEVGVALGGKSPATVHRYLERGREHLSARLGPTAESELLGLRR